MLMRQVTDQANLTIPKTRLAPALENSVRLHEMLMEEVFKWPGPGLKIDIRALKRSAAGARTFSSLPCMNTFQPACRFADFDVATTLTR
jgi:hypothetical protein